MKSNIHDTSASELAKQFQKNNIIMSKKIFIISTLSLLLFACGKKEDNTNVDALIASKNVTELQAKKALIQADLTKIDEALAKLDVKKDEALVSVETVKDTVFSHYLEVQGSVDTKENILVQPEYQGTLISLTVKAGQRVSKGQILGRIDDAGLSQQVASLENQYALAKTTFERQKNLWDQKIGSEIQYLQAQTQMVSAQRGVAQIKAQLAKTIIKAPFTGTIDEVFVEKGQVVGPSAQGLMRIVNLSNMYVSTSVPETYIGKLKVGTEVDVLLTSLGKTENLLRPNQVASLKITDYVNKNAVVVPTNVIQEDGSKNKYVYIVSNSNGKTGIAKKVIVKPGQTSGNVTEILSGLSAEDIIVTEGANTISEGMKLNF